jgi:CheY-like chemotaxis protein
LHSGSQYYIMVAEDEPMVRHVLVRTVQLASPDAIPVEVVTASEGVQVLQHTHFTAVLTDYHMEGGSGLDIVRAAKAQDPEMPVLVISALSKTVEEQALAAGANYVLPKPFDVPELISIIRVIISQFGKAA